MINLNLYCDVVYKKIEQGELTLTLFLDNAKALDSISHNLHKLAKIGFDHEFSNFLHLIPQTENKCFFFLVIHCLIPAI